MWLKCIGRVLGCVAVMLAASGTAGATIVSFDEATAGDIVETAFGLDVGINTIAGTSGAQGDGSRDFDDFSFVVAPGTELVGLSLTATLVTGATFDFGWEMFTDGFGLGASLGRLETFPPGSDAFAGLPLAAGDYFMFQVDMDPLEKSADFLLTLTVRALPTGDVPEPASLLLAATALLAAASVRRRCA